MRRSARKTGPEDPSGVAARAQDAPPAGLAQDQDFFIGQVESPKTL
jgi:hypothetical protein